MKTGIAIFGAGRWGINLIRNFLAIEEARVVVITDPHEAQLQSLPQRLGSIWDERVHLTTNWSDVLKMKDIEAVVIATPATTHYTLISTALETGYHVLAEKPLTIDPAESVKLCQLAEKQQRQLVIDHTYLFHPAVERGKIALQQSKLGDLRYGYAARTNLGPVRYDVDAMWDLAIHDIAIFNNWLGETPTQVQATGRVWLQPSQETAKQHDNGLADLVWVTLTYPSGFQAFIHLCWLNPDKQRRLGVVGSKGSLIFDELSTSPLTIQYGSFEQKDNLFVPINLNSEVLNLEPNEPLRQVCTHFLDCVKNNTPSQISSGWVGANLVQILSCLSESLQQGGQIVSVNSQL